MAGLTADGFVAKTFAEIRAGFEEKQRAGIAANLDTSDFSIIGQMNGIMATEIAALWELAEELNDAFDPDKASDDAQDTLYSLTNTLRGKPAKSTVVATVSLNAGASIAKGLAQASVQGNTSAKFVNDEVMENTGGVPTTKPVRFIATQTGPIIANTHTLTVIDIPQTGWTAITNEQDATPGNLTELNSAYRLRRLDELASQGGGTTPGIRADLLKIETVRAALVRENTGNLPAGILPAKSIQAIVRSDVGAGDELLIAQAIWRNKASGIQTVGSEYVSITDADGFVQVVQFSRPTERSVYVNFQVMLDATAYVGDDAFKSAIVAAVGDPSAEGYFDVSDEVYAGRLVSAAMKVPGVLNAEAGVTFGAELELPFASWQKYLAIGDTEIAAFDTYRISVNVVTP